MKKKIIGILVCILVIVATVLTVGENVKALIPEENKITAGFSKGWIEVCDGITILHLKGSYYEMGYEYGSLLKEEILYQLKLILPISFTTPATSRPYRPVGAPRGHSRHYTLELLYTTRTLSYLRYHFVVDV